MPGGGGGGDDGSNGVLSPWKPLPPLRQHIHGRERLHDVPGWCQLYGKGLASPVAHLCCTFSCPPRTCFVSHGHVHVQDGTCK